MKYTIPADVPSKMEARYKKNLKTATNGTHRLMLFAGDQKVEHLNNDFYERVSPKRTMTLSICSGSLPKRRSGSLRLSLG